MRYEDINRKFTETVASYINGGYRFNTSTMSGSQGEIAKVDLTNGKEVVRINLAKIHEHEDGFWCDGIELTIGIATDNILPDDSNTWRTLWTSNCVTVHREVWYNAGRNSDYLVTKEEAVAAHNKRVERYKLSYTAEKEVPDKARKIVLSYVKRQPRCKSAKVEDVTVKRVGRDWYVKYKDKSWKLA